MVDLENIWYDYGIKNNVVYDKNGNISKCHDCYGITQLGKNDPEFLMDNVFETRVTIAMKTLFPSYSDNLVGNSEMVFQNNPEINKIHSENKSRRNKLIIVGGGPSTNEVKWENLKYDYIWSSNHFYKSDKLKDRKVDLAYLGQEVDYNNSELREYINKFKPLVAFEPAGKWFESLIPSSVTMYAPFKQSKEPIIQDYLKNHICVMSKFYGVLGVGLRQLIFALFLGFKEIYFVGLDGLPGFNTPHSFETGKLGAGAPHKEGAMERYKKHYVHYWNYILSMIGDDVNFYNLGEYSEHNMSKEISLQNFPLNNEIKKSIGV